MEFLVAFLVSFLIIFTMGVIVDKSTKLQWMKSKTGTDSKGRLIQSIALAIGIAAGQEIAATSLSWQKSIVVGLSVGICMAVGQLVLIFTNRQR